MSTATMKMMRRPPATAMLTMAGRLSGLSGAMYTIPGEYSMPPTRAWQTQGRRELGAGQPGEESRVRTRVWLLGRSILRL
jgi:hypothetical protein